MKNSATYLTTSPIKSIKRDVINVDTFADVARLHRHKAALGERQPISATITKDIMIHTMILRRMSCLSTVKVQHFFASLNHPMTH